MPLNDYECPTCGASVRDRWTVSITPPLPVCEECGSTMQRIYHAAELNFIGEGFFVNDYSEKNGEQDDSEANNS